jgi:hypothetical protein
MKENERFFGPLFTPRALPPLVVSERGRPAIGIHHGIEVALGGVVFQKLSRTVRQDRLERRSQRMPPLAPLTGNLEPIAKAFTTSKSNPSSPLFNNLSQAISNQMHLENETKCQ